MLFLAGIILVVGSVLAAFIAALSLGLWKPLSPDMKKRFEKLQRKRNRP